jgi:hypothetical protein
MTALVDFERMLGDDQDVAEHRAALRKARDWASWRLAALPDGPARQLYQEICHAVSFWIYRRCSAECLSDLRSYCHYLGRAARIAEKIDAGSGDVQH